MRRVVLGLLLAGMASAVPAQVLYRCTAKGKPTTFQHEPCTAGTKTASVAAYSPDPAPSANDLAWQRYRTEQEMRRRHSAERAAPGRTYVVQMPLPARESCSAAKAERDAWERKVGLSRTVDQLRYWTERVSRACQ